MKPLPPTWEPIPLKIQEGLGKRVKSYLRGAFSGFCRKQLSLKWWHPLHWIVWLTFPAIKRHSRRPIHVLPQPVLALPLMWNTGITENRKIVAPALLIGTFDFSKQGVRDLFAAANRFNSPATATQQAERDAIMADEEYQEFRCRPIPPSFGVSPSVYLFDQMMSQGNLLLDKKSKVPVVAPFVVLAGTSPAGPYEIIQVKMARWVIKAVEKVRGSLGLANPDLWAQGTADTSGSGSPIRRYSEKDLERPASADEGKMELLDEISAHIERHIGPIENVFHELVSDHVHIDIHIVPPTPDRPYYYLVTSGMSELRMAAPEQMPDCTRAELCLALPAEWDFSDNNNEANYWPLRWLKILAKFPHQLNTWFWEGHSLPAGDPPQAIADTQFTGFVLLPPTLAPEAFDRMYLPGGEFVQFFSIIPVYEEEMNLKLREGAAALADRLNAAGMSEFIVTSRANVAVPS